MEFIDSKSNTVTIGQQIARLTIVAIKKKVGTRHTYAVCNCECGLTDKYIRLDSISSGITQSCGCYHKESVTKHGLYKHIHYKRWSGIMERCYNKRSQAYCNYGGRGIIVCKDWHDVSTFINELPDNYFKGAEIDRIDNDGNYEPNNVRWATSSENCDNRRTGRYIEFNGKTQSLNAWAKELYIHEMTLKSRLDNSGYSIEKAFTNKKFNVTEYEYNGKIKTLDEISKENGISKKIITSRIHHGFSIYEAVSKTHLQRRTSKKYEYNGDYLTIKELSELSGLSVNLLRKRINERKWSVKRAVEEKIN